MKEIDVILLAGGNSKRMTFPKEYITIDGEYLVHKIIKKLNLIFEEIIVVSNNKKHYEKLPCKVVRDIFYKKGPMAGLHSGLVISNMKYSILLACDMPNIDLDFIKFLITQVDEKHNGVVCLNENGEIMPMYGIYKNDLKINLKKDLIKENLKIKTFIKDNNFKYIDYDTWKKYSKLDIFENLNYLEDLKKVGK